MTDFKLFEMSATRNIRGAIVGFITRHLILFMIGAVLLLILLLWLLFLLIRGIIRRITGKKPRKKKKGSEETVSADEAQNGGQEQ